MNDKRIILVPVAGHIEPECESSLDALERAGYLVHRVWGYSDISRGRSQLATDALAEGFEELIWIDSDMEFSPEAVARLCSHNLPIVGAIYPVKNERRLACKPLPGVKEIVFGQEGGLKPFQYLATGFLLTRREVYVSIQAKFSLPNCVSASRHGLVPYFQQLIIPEGESGRHLYLSEGFSFCERALQCGFQIMADTTIQVRHIGRASVSWASGAPSADGKTYRYSIRGAG